MTTNINSQVLPQDDPNIAFYHTFELSLSQKDKQVRIIYDNEVVGKIPLKAFWNSRQCNDQNYYRIHISDMNNSSEEEAWILKNPLLKKTYYERSGKDAVEIVGEIVNEVNDAVGNGDMADTGNSRSFTIKEKEIPELEKNHQVQYTKEMEFKFFKRGSDCEVLTVEGANPSYSRISIDLPSKACVHTDDGKLQCRDSKGVHEIKKSDKYYMTMTKDNVGHYKYYFSDQDGKKIDDLEFRLSDIRVKNPTMLKILESSHRISKLHQKSQDIDEKLTQHVNSDASPLAVAESLLESKGPELGDAILRAIVSCADGNADRVLSRLARDTTLQSEVAKDLKEDTDFQGKIKGNVGKDGPRGNPGPRGADGTPGKDANPAEVVAKLFAQPMQLGRAVLDIKGTDQKSKLATELASDDTLKRDVGILLKDDIEKDVGGLPRMARSVQDYETRVQRIEEKMEGEERKILEIKQEAISAATESMRYAQRSENEANRSKTAADASEEHAKRSSDAAGVSEGHAQRSETAAGKSEGHEINARGHSENAERLSSNAAEFADNAEESADCAKILADHAKMLANHAKTSADCAKNPSLQECSSRAGYTENSSLQKCLSGASLSRSRREAVWEESEDSEPQYEESGLTFFPTDSVSVV